jgi:transcriptional regulator with XRE-family HTH domain
MDLKQIIKTRGYTQASLARKMEVPANYMTHICRGYEQMSASRMKSFCDILSIEYVSFVNGKIVPKEY